MLTDRLRQIAPSAVVSALGLVNQTSVERATLITSNSVTISGLVGPAAIAVTGGSYSINGAAFTATAGTIANGNTLRIQHTSAAGYLTITTTSIQIGVSVSTWSTSTRAQDTQPASFGFAAVANAALSTVQTSGSMTVSAMDSDVVATVTVSGGNYSKNGAGYAATATTAVNGDVFSLQHVSSASYSTAVQTILTVNNQQAIFQSTTRAQDVVPAAFGFTALTGVEPATVYLSNAVTITGMDTGAVATVTVSGGSYSKNGGALTTAAGTAQNADIFVVSRLSAAASAPLTAASAVLTVGGLSGTFTVTTRAADQVPSAFAFTDVTNSTLSTVYVSDPVTVSGIDTGYSVAVSVTGTSGSGFGYSKNGGAYTTSAGTAALGDVFTVRTTSNAAGGIAHTCALTIGGIGDTYSVTTRIGDTTPDPYTFTDLTNQACNTDILSNVFIVTGIESGYSANVSLSGTGSSWRKNGGGWFSAGIGGTVALNDTVQIKVATGNTLSQTFTANINIGGVPDSWTVVTGSDGSPDAFAFTDVTEAPISTLYTSASVTVAGMTAGYSAPVSLSGTSGANIGYSKNGGAYTTSAGTAVPADTFAVRVRSASAFSTANTCTLTIGGVSDTFSVTTRPADTIPDAFAFSDLTNQACNATLLSNIVTIAGIESGYSASVTLSGTGTSWRKNGGGWIPAGTGGTVTTNDTVQLQVVTDNTLALTWTASLTIGGVSDSWSVTTGNDGEPDAYTFNDYTGVVRSTEYVSNIITISGLTPGYRAPVACSGDAIFSPRFRINGSTVVSMGTLGSIANGETLEAMLLSSPNPLTAAAIQVAVGGGTVFDIWSITTA